LRAFEQIRRTLPLLVAAACLASVGCAQRPGPLDLLRSTARLKEASVAGRGFKWITGQVGKTVRINDAVRRTLPASPPSRLLYTLDVPEHARLAFDIGIPEERHDKPGVEFLVKVRDGDREQVLWSQLLDPAGRPQHRRWLPVDLDLAKLAGHDVDLILETRGFDAGDEARAAFWATPAITRVAGEAPLVVLYLVDTLRADHTQPYGYLRDTTPQLLAFAKDAVVFEQAIVQASWTKPSVASIFTSLLPGRHRAVQLRDPLDRDLVTLAEMLETKGFTTGAAIANSVIYNQGSHFEQGFDSFTGLHGPGNRPSKIIEAAPVVNAALAFLDARRGFPTFLYVHTMDPHVPYTPPAPFDRKYDPYPTKGHPGQDPRTDYKEPLDRDRLTAQYDGEIAYGDREFGRFVQGLKERGLYERAQLIFVADHGEEFLDHGKWLHGRSVFDELVRVPLIVKFPERRDAGRRVADQVQGVDLLPTILKELRLPVPKPPAIEGRPLQDVVAGRAPQRPALSEISHRGFVAHGMRTRRDKYVRRFSPEDDELYFDLEKDPRETTNLVEQAGERVKQLRAGVEEAMIPNPFRHVVKAAGRGEYALRVRTGGWFEGVEATGLGQGESYDVEGNGRRLVLKLAPKKDQAREVSFTVRPQGAPVWLDGTRDGKPLRVQDVFVAMEGLNPTEVPVKLPEVESPTEDARALSDDVFEEPAVDRPGLRLWLRKIPGRELLEIDKEARERLKALGYVGN
jgi:arylsulfatase A-like enzyme